MENNLVNRKQYKENGYFITKNFFSKDIISQIIKELENIKNVDKYFDKKGRLRRIERLYNKVDLLIEINNEILIFLQNIFKKEFIIFKDKYNSKPPGGEGFNAHFDGIFVFQDANGIKQPGWYKYTNYFVNVLVALDPCDKKNGTIEIANCHNESYEKLLLKTKQNGTPFLTQEIEESLSFKIIDLDPGDVTVFSSTCPHRSRKNNSIYDRRTLYNTYTLLKEGSYYEQYFIDKHASKNTTSKSLNDEY